jgi:hypothetical protein
MNTEYFFIHVILLGVLTLVFAALGCVFAIAAHDNEEKRTRWILCTAASAILFVGGLTWWIASANEQWRYEFTSLHEIKDVTFPDGSKVQMFTCDNVHHNVTSMFGKVVDPKDWVIRRVKWSPLYLGVSWSSYERCHRDHYFLEHRKGELPSVEISEKPKTDTK